jgi:hypothetical protein
MTIQVMPATAGIRFKPGMTKIKIFARRMINWVVVASFLQMVFYTSAPNKPQDMMSKVA